MVTLISKTNHRGLQRLRRLWSKWVRVLEHFARARPGKPMSALTYQQLHRQLLEAVNAYDDWIRDPVRPAYDKLHSVARPWVSLESLATADQMLLARLLAQSRRLETSVFGRLTVFAGLKITAAMFTVALLAACGTWAVEYFHSPLAHGNLLEMFWRDTQRIAWALVSSSHPYRLVIAWFIIVLLCSWAVTVIKRY